MRRKCTIVLVCLLVAADAQAAAVAVIKSKDIKQYNETFDGFKGRCKAEIKEFNLEALGEAALTQQVGTMSPNAIFAIGPAAAKTAHTAFPSVPVIYAVVPNPDGIGLKGANVTGVAMSVHPRRHFALLKALPNKIGRVGVI